MLRAIDDSEISISYSDASCTIQKRILPTLNTGKNYTVDYGTPLAREDTKFKIFSAPGYTQLDDNGVLRTCFLEETPGSSSGVESISVVAAPNVYERIPTIEIVGDGVGAGQLYPERLARGAGLLCPERGADQDRQRHWFSPRCADRPHRDAKSLRSGTRAGIARRRDTRAGLCR